MNIFGFLALSYLALLVVVWLHELGHRGDKVVWVRFFPFPEAYSKRARSRYGGLLVNIVLFVGIFLLKPDNIFLQLIGFKAWVHFIFYMVWGSFNYEPVVPRALEKYFVYDDVPNSAAPIAVPLGILAVIYFQAYYLGLTTAWWGLL
jgi:hypothetical protein